MQVAHNKLAPHAYPTQPPQQTAAFLSLQNAILRLASKPPARPGGFARQELSALVDQALEAYREYMKLA
jgi:hypothetical protein